MMTRAAPLLALTIGLTACRGPRVPEGGIGLVDSTAGTVTSPFPVRLTTEESRGRRLFDDKCASCHGSEGRGDTAAVPKGADGLPDLSDKRYGAMAPAQLAARFGAAHDTNTPPLLSPGEARAVLDYLPVLAYPPDARGSALVGKRLYGRYCASCHGVHGDGDGPAAALLSTRPTDLAVDTLVAARDFDALARLIRDGPAHAHVSSMPSWGTFFDVRMLQDVAAYLPTFREGPRPIPSASGSPPG